MPVLVTGIYVAPSHQSFASHLRGVATIWIAFARSAKWMAGTSPAMTVAGEPPFRSRNTNGESVHGHNQNREICNHQGRRTRAPPCAGAGVFSGFDRRDA